MNCLYCEKELADDMLFCPYCGKPVSGEKEKLDISTQKKAISKNTNGKRQRNGQRKPISVAVKEAWEALKASESSTVLLRDKQQCSEKQIENAIRSYATEADPDTIVAMLDQTWARNGKKGVLITEERLYSTEMKGDQKWFDFSDMVSAEINKNKFIIIRLKDGSEKKFYAGFSEHLITLMRLILEKMKEELVVSEVKNEDELPLSEKKEKVSRVTAKEEKTAQVTNHIAQEEMMPSNEPKKEKPKKEEPKKEKPKKEEPKKEKPKKEEPKKEELKKDELKPEELLTEERLRELDRMAERARSMRVGGQEQKALRLFEEVAEQGGCNALITLAEYRRTGKYLKKDLQLSENLFLRAESNAYTDLQKSKIANGLQKIEAELIEPDMLAGKIVEKKFPSELEECSPGSFIRLCNGNEYTENQLLKRCQEEILAHNENGALYLLLKGYPRFGWRSPEYCGRIRDLFMNEESALYDPEYGLAWHEEMVNQGYKNRGDELIRLALAYRQHGLPEKAEETLHRLTDGGAVRFGTWEFCSNIQPIIWRVIAKNDAGVYLAGCVAIVQRCFDEQETLWPNAQLRQWMNGTFFKNAFSEEEKQIIGQMHARKGNVEWTDRVRLMYGSELKAHFNQKDYEELSTWDLRFQTEPGGEYNKRKKLPPFGMSEKDQAANQYRAPMPVSGQPEDPEEKKRQRELRKKMRAEFLENTGSDWWLLDEENGYCVSRKRRADNPVLCAAENPTDQTYMVYPVICLNSAEDLWQDEEYDDTSYGEGAVDVVDNEKSGGILICDDAAFMRTMIKDILTENGYKIAGEAENGVVAIEKYKEIRPDLVIMDITMPEMNGIEATKKILDFDPDARIIMCSVMAQRSMILESVKAGAKDYITKPFQPERIMKAIKKVIG